MNASGGGVTASGGEAILQAEFVRDWFAALQKEKQLIIVPTVLFVVTIR